MKRTLLILFTAMVMIFASCRTQKPIVATEPVHQPEAEPEVITPVQPPKLCVAATFDCSFDGIKASGLLRMKEDSVIWISVSKFIELGRMSLTPEEAVGYLKLQNRYFKGSYDVIAKRTGYKTDFATLQGLILEALASDDKKLVVPINTKQLKGTLKVTFKKVEREETLSYPINIPSNAKVL